MKHFLVLSKLKLNIKLFVVWLYLAIFKSQKSSTIPASLIVSWTSLIFFFQNRTLTASILRSNCGSVISNKPLDLCESFEEPERSLLLHWLIFWRKERLVTCGGVGTRLQQFERKFEKEGFIFFVLQVSSFHKFCGWLCSLFGFLRLHFPLEKL